MKDKKSIKIVVVGAGFAGVYALKEILKSKNKNIELEIINKTDYFLFTPLLHEVASGNLSPNVITHSITEIIGKKKWVKLKIGKVERINFEEKSLMLDSGQTRKYDYLILSTGGKTNSFNISGVEDFSLYLKTLNDAVKIKNKLIEIFEEKSKSESKQIRINIVGGGYTGVELAAELPIFVKSLLKKYNSLEEDLISIKVIEASDQIMRGFSTSLRSYAEKQLEKNRIEVLKNSVVKQVKANGLILESKEIDSDITVWAAGVQPSYPDLAFDKLKKERSKISIDKYLRVQKSANVFAAGDLAYLEDISYPHGLPTTAQVASQQGKVLGQNVLRSISQKPLLSFEYNHKGMLASLGKFNAIGEIKGFKLKGIIMWILWRTVYLYKFISFKKKLKIAKEWTINLVKGRNIDYIEYK